MNILPPAIRFKGDRDKAIALKAQALQFYNFVVSQANTGGINFVSKNNVLSDGSVISVTSKMESNYDNRSGVILIITPPDNNLLEEFELYMESGFYDLLSSATCAEATYRPAVLHYNPPIQSYISSDSTPQQGLLDFNLDGEQLVDGFESISVGGKKLTNQVFDKCGTSYSSTDNIYTLKPEDILKQKQAQNRIPSSFFSGKLRLYVQALYGSLRTDYRINTSFISGLPEQGDYKLYVEDTLGNDFELIWDYPYTSGIYTTSDYKYYLMKVVTNTIQIYPMTLSPSGEKLRAAINSSGITDPVELSRLEGYMLSTAKIDTTKVFSINISGAVSISGGPLAYGWKFSQSGKQCTVVVHEDISPLGNLKKFQASELTVDITELDGVFTASMMITKTGTWSHNTWFVPWVPDFYQYSQIQYGTFDTGSEMSTDLCPLYGWYESEEYKPVDVTITIANRVDSGNNPIVVIVSGCGDMGNMVDTDWNFNGYNGSGRFSGISDLTFNKVIGSLYRVSQYYWTSDVQYSSFIGVSSQTGANGSYTVCEIGNSCYHYLYLAGHYTYNGVNYNIIWTDGGDGYDYGVSGRTYYKQLVYDTRIRTGVNDTGKLGLIIPLLDAEACVTIVKQIESSAANTLFVGQRNSSAQTPSKMKLVHVKRDGAGSVTVIDEFGGDIQLSRTPEFTFGSAGSGVGGQPLDSGSANVKISEKTASVYPLNEDGYTIRTGSGTAATVAWADNYLWATFGTTLGGKTIVAKSSFNGSNITYHGEGDGNNINGYRNHNAVGWS